MRLLYRAEAQQKVKEWKKERAAEQLAQKVAEVASKNAVFRQEGRRQTMNFEKKQQAKQYREEKVDELA